MRIVRIVQVARAASKARYDAANLKTLPDLHRIMRFVLAPLGGLNVGESPRR